MLGEPPRGLSSRRHPMEPSTAPSCSSAGPLASDLVAAGQPRPTPPASAPLAQHWIPRIERRIQLKQGKWKGANRLYVRLLDGAHQEFKVWMSFSASERVGDILTAMPFMIESDLSDDFKAALCAGKRAHFASNPRRACQNLLPPRVCL